MYIREHWNWVVMDGVKDARKNYLAACDVLGRLTHGAWSRCMWRAPPRICAGGQCRSRMCHILFHVACMATLTLTLNRKITHIWNQLPLSRHEIKCDASRKKIKKKEVRKDIPVAWKHAVQDCCIKAFPNRVGLMHKLHPAKTSARSQALYIRVDDKGLQSDPAILQLLMHDV